MEEFPGYCEDLLDRPGALPYSPRHRWFRRWVKLCETEDENIDVASLSYEEVCRLDIPMKDIVVDL
jgi:hypothetical protein